MSAETITTRLHAKADADLRVKIETALKNFRQELADAGVSIAYMRPKIHRNFLCGVDSKELPYAAFPELIAMQFDQLVRSLPEAAFAVGCENNRTRAVDDYMRRIEELAEKCEELEQQISEVQS